jgi:hypothetical protein
MRMMAKVRRFTCWFLGYHVWEGAIFEVDAPDDWGFAEMEFSYCRRCGRSE